MKIQCIKRPIRAIVVLFMALLYLSEPVSVFSQKKIKGTVVVTSEQVYFIQNRFIVRDSTALISCLSLDTLLSLPVGGHNLMSIYSQGDSIQIGYVYNSHDGIIFSDKAYYCSATVTLLSNHLNDYLGKDVLKHYIYVNDKKVLIRSKFLNNISDFETSP